MSKHILYIISAAILLTGCSTAGQGAYTGGQFGYVIGSAIGGITGGWRGHDWGSLIGTVGGVAAGAAVGAANEAKRNKAFEEATNDRKQSAGVPDDRVDLGLTGPGEPPLEIRYAVIEESKHDGVLTRGEECKVRFEIHNTSDHTVRDIRPIVCDVTENKHVKISPNLLIESIGPREGIRYSATILADKKLKDGEIKVMVGVSHGKREVKSQTRYFTVSTAKGVR